MRDGYRSHLMQISQDMLYTCKCGNTLFGNTQREGEAPKKNAKPTEG